ncbi:MAG: heavy metal sensor histidine kinase, partial [Wenzhouxiangellaceae bacterium]
FRRNLLLLIVGSIALMSLLGWIAVRQGHAPLHDIVERIRRIRADELALRLSPEVVPGELTELAVTFNEMLERVDQAFHRLSAFNADIAHELRTPIANLMTQTEVGLSRERTADEYREILYSNMEEYQRMAQMVGNMLFLAQSENRGHEQNVTEFDLASEVRALFDFYEGWAEERGVTLALTGAARVTGDRLMLRRALSNLLSNAIHHAPAGGYVRVALAASKNGGTRVSVANPGPTIPPEHIPRLFDRFYRIDPSRQQSDQGVGLGLAIVKMIVNAHDGSIDVVSAKGRTRFEIDLPARSAADANGARGRNGQ